MIDWSELLNINEYIKLFVGLFAMADPISVAPVFMGVAAGFSLHERRQMAFISALTMLIVMLVFLFSGTLILDVFGVSLGAFTAMGGVILFFMGLDLMKSNHEDFSSTEKAKHATPISVAIVPIAIPLLAGPGTLSTVIVFSARHDSFEHQVVMLIVFCCLSGVTYALLRGARYIGDFIGVTGLVVFNKIMGMIVLAIAIEFLFDGIALHFPSLQTVNDVAR